MPNRGQDGRNRGVQGTCFRLPRKIEPSSSGKRKLQRSDSAFPPVLDKVPVSDLLHPLRELANFEIITVYEFKAFTDNSINILNPQNSPPRTGQSAPDTTADLTQPPSRAKNERRSSARRGNSQPLPLSPPNRRKNNSFWKIISFDTHGHPSYKRLARIPSPSTIYQ